MSAEQWRAALARDASSVDGSASPEVLRMVIEVSVGTRRGLVTASLREGRAFFVDESGATTGPLVQGARTWLENLVAEGSTGDARPSLRELRMSLPPRANESDALRDFALTFWRSGIAGAKRGALEDSLRQVRLAASKTSQARWMARFQQALVAEDVHALAHLLRGALEPSKASTQTLSDLRLVEVAREHVDAKSARQLERRTLIDLADGNVYSEERLQGAVASIGPMPRVLDVGLAEAQLEASPPSLSIHQYTLQATLDATTGTQLEALAERDFTRLMARVDSALAAHPGFAEPVFLVAPTSWGSDAKREQLDMRDAGDVALRMSDEDVSACLTLLDVLRERTPAWLVVRAAPRAGAHAFVPLSCGHLEGEAWVVRRLRG